MKTTSVCVSSLIIYIRRWANIGQTMARCVVFAGFSFHNFYTYFSYTSHKIIRFEALIALKVVMYIPTAYG